MQESHIYRYILLLIINIVLHVKNYTSQFANKKSHTGEWIGQVSIF